MLSTSFLEKDSSVSDWEAVGGWVRMCRNCVHMGCAVSFVLFHGDCHAIFSHNPLFQPLSSLPCASFLSHHPLHPPSQLHFCVSPPLYCPVFFPHPSFSRLPFFSPRCLSICLDKMDGLQKLNDASNGKTKKWKRQGGFFSTTAEQKQTTLWKTCQHHSPYLHS